MKIRRLIFLSNLKYYLFIAFSGIVAFLPVSFMIFSLKNDIVAIDYPIKYFISQCLQHHTQPFWFNTWAKGYPLESILTWSFFSPLQFLVGILFSYNLYTLHAEFIFYILVAGFGMFSFLKEHVSPNKELCLVMAISYMLSGFSVGSSQWMTYLTAAAFLPLVLCCFMRFLKTPSFSRSILLVAVYYIMLTSVYPAFTIISTYLMAGSSFLYLTNKWKKDRAFFGRTKFWKWSLLTISLMVLTYSTSIYFSFKVLNEIERGAPLAAGSHFFHSNYLHPKGLVSLLLPFSSTKIQVPNTEGSMMDCYFGLFAFFLLPLSILKNIQEKNGRNLLLLIVACFFLLASFGHLTPFREVLNILPGFSYFRNPALFRLFFIFFLLIYLTGTYKLSSPDILTGNKRSANVFLLTLAILGICLLWVAAANLDAFIQWARDLTSLKEALHGLTFSNTLFMSAVLQLVLLLLFFIAIKKSTFKLLLYLCALDLVVNCLICTPFFTVSSYTVKKINNRIFKSTNSFPAQLTNTGEVSTIYQSGRAIWYNINIYQKQVSSQQSYFGPLVLKSALKLNPQDSTLYNRNTVLFSPDKQVDIQLQGNNPNNISAFIETKKPVTVFLQQNFYSAWHAYFDNNEISIKSIPGAMAVTVPRSGRLEFKYERTLLFIVTIILNCLILGTILYFVTDKLVRTALLQKQIFTSKQLSADFKDLRSQF